MRQFTRDSPQRFHQTDSRTICQNWAPSHIPWDFFKAAPHWLVVQEVTQLQAVNTRKMGKWGYLHSWLADFMENPSFNFPYFFGNLEKMPQTYHLGIVSPYTMPCTAQRNDDSLVMVDPIGFTNSRNRRCWAECVVDCKDALIYGRCVELVEGSS